MNLSEQPQKKIPDDFFPGIQRMYRKIFLCWIAVAVVVIGMSSLFANIRGKANSYQANADWQACLTSADNQYVPIAGSTQLEPLQLTSHDPKSDFQSCVVNLARNGTCSIGCLQAMNSTCGSAKNPEELHSCVLNLCEKGTCSVDCLLSISSACFLPVPPLNNTPTASPTPSPVLLPTTAPTYSPDDMAEFKNCLIGLEVNGTCSMECLVDIGTNCYAANTKTAMTNCIIGLYLNGSCSIQCLMGISTCQPLAPPHNDTPTAIPSFAPVVTPTRSPTNSPVFAPTTAPTYSPSEIADFKQCMAVLARNGTCSIDCVLAMNSTCSSAKTKEEMSACALSLYSNGTCSFGCLLGISSTCVPVVNNSVASFSSSSSSSSSQSIYTAVPAGNLLGGLTSLGIQAVVLSALGHFAMRKTLTENSYYLPVAITFLVWLILAIVNYSTTFAPVLPIPGDLNSSFFTIVYYELFDYRNKFENFNNGNNHCQEANRFVWFFMILISFLVLSLIGSLLLGVHVWNYLSHRRQQEQKEQESKKASAVKNAMALNVVVGLVVLFSSLLTISKMMSSVNILNAIDHFQMNQQEAMLQGKSIWFSQIWFPFQSQQQQQSIGFDLSTLFGLLSFGGILFYQRASPNQEQSMKLLKLSFVSGLLFLVTLYPEMIGSVQFYHSHRFQNDLDCQSFFQEKSKFISFWSLL